MRACYYQGESGPEVILTTDRDADEDEGTLRAIALGAAIAAGLVGAEEGQMLVEELLAGLKIGEVE